MVDNKLVTICCLATATIALFFTLFGNFWCRFAVRPVTLTLTDGTSEELSIDLGIWNIKNVDTGGCVGWGTLLSPDPKWNAAKVFSIFTTLIGGASIATIMFGDGGKKMWLIVSVLSFFALLFQGLTFIFLQSYICSKAKSGDSLYYMLNQSGRYDIASCQLGPGSGMAVFAALVWGAIGVAAAYLAIVDTKESSSSDAPNQPATESKGARPEDVSLQAVHGSKEIQSEDISEQAIVDESTFVNP
jgi:hypothetical protein